jgi:hypothetical protein
MHNKNTGKKHSELDYILCTRDITIFKLVTSAGVICFYPFFAIHVESKVTCGRQIRKKKQIDEYHRQIFWGFS